MCCLQCAPNCLEHCKWVIALEVVLKVRNSYYCANLPKIIFYSVRYKTVSGMRKNWTPYSTTSQCDLLLIVGKWFNEKKWFLKIFVKQILALETSDLEDFWVEKPPLTGYQGLRLIFDIIQTALLASVPYLNPNNKGWFLTKPVGHRSISKLYKTAGT